VLNLIDRGLENYPSAGEVACCIYERNPSASKHVWSNLCQFRAYTATWRIKTSANATTPSRAPDRVIIMREQVCYGCKHTLRSWQMRIQRN